MTAGGWPHGRSRDGGIDVVPLPLPAGGLALCGKHAIGPDPIAAMARVGATTVVCLVRDHEIADRFPDYVDWLRAEDGGRAIRLPIDDFHAPPLDVAIEFVGELRARVERGEFLLMHCAGGIGRAGTMAVCLLLEFGVPLDDALVHVAAHRPMAGPEVGAQRDLVEAYALAVERP